jgi:outer membrane protein insertion porin family
VQLRLQKCQVQTLKSYYFNLGYLDFKVTDVKSDLSKDKQSIDIAIQVDEGSKYKVGKIEFTGNMLNESSESLSKLLTLSTGNIFKRKKIIDSLKTITDLYGAVRIRQTNRKSSCFGFFYRKI